MLILHVYKDGHTFMDITNNPRLGSNTKVLQYHKTSPPAQPMHNDTIKPLLKELNKHNMRENLETFSSFHTRYYKSDYGVQSQKWLLGRVTDMLSSTNASYHSSSSSPSTDDKQTSTNATVTTFPHPWGQSSIILRIPGQSDKTVIISAHQDSINLFLPSILAAPGADDDGSGTVTILEAARVFLHNTTSALAGTFPNTVEFHWYSAEEGGLLGSQAVYQAYKHAGRDVIATLQLDAVGYDAGSLAHGHPESIGIVTDHVDGALTDFISLLVTEYCDVEVALTQCGYACSDHASAHKAGYASACVMESKFKDMDPRFHTGDDKVEYLSFEHMLEFAKVALSFAYEMASV